MPFPRFVPHALLLISIAPVVAHAQAAPTASAPSPYEGFSLPNIGGSLRFSLTASETVVTGYNGSPGTGTTTYTDFSGNLAYLSRSETHPFSAVYSGGYLIGNSQVPSYPFQTLSLSQVARTRDWTFTVSDQVNYLPQTPATGLSGVPGAGDINVPPVQVGPNTGLGILTQYATRVSNIVSGTATRQLTGSTSVSGTGAYFIQRYTGSSANGINNDLTSGSISVDHRLNALSSVGGSYSYAHSSFSYLPGLLALAGSGSSSYDTQTAQGTYFRQFSRKLSITAGAGPQWITPGDGRVVRSSSINFSANAAVTYTAQNYSSGISYIRSVNNGDGVVVGTRNDVVAATASRAFARIYQVSGLVGFNRSTQLANTLLPSFNSSAVIAGGQVSVQIARPVSAFASYTLQRQLFTGFSPALNDFNGLSQYVTVGVTYSPHAFLTRK